MAARHAARNKTGPRSEPHLHLHTTRISIITWLAIELLSIRQTEGVPVPVSVTCLRFVPGVPHRHACPHTHIPSHLTCPTPALTHAPRTHTRHTTPMRPHARGKAICWSSRTPTATVEPRAQSARGGGTVVGAERVAYVGTYNTHTIDSGDRHRRRYNLYHTHRYR